MTAKKPIKKSAPKKASEPIFPKTQLGLYMKTLWTLSLKDKELAALAWETAERELKFSKKLLQAEEAIHRARAQMILQELGGVSLWTIR